MGWFGDLADEWKKASTGEKIMLGGGVIGIVAIALYLHNQSSQATPAGPQTGAITGATGGGNGGGGIQTVPGPNGSQLPILPGGLCQQFDQQGNITGYIPCATPPITPIPPTPTPGPKPTPGPTKCPRGQQLCNGKCQPVTLLCRNELKPKHTTHPARSANIVPNRVIQRTPPIHSRSPGRQHTTVTRVSAQRHIARPRTVQKTLPWTSSPGTINPFPG